MPAALIRHSLYIQTLYSSKLNKKQRLHLHAYVLYLISSLGVQAWILWILVCIWAGVEEVLVSVRKLILRRAHHPQSLLLIVLLPLAASLSYKVMPVSLAMKLNLFGDPGQPQVQDSPQCLYEQFYSQDTLALILIHLLKLKHRERGQRGLNTKFLKIPFADPGQMAPYAPLMKHSYFGCIACFLDRMCYCWCRL